MADYTVKKHKAFTVKVEGVKEEFKIPALDDLPLDVITIFTSITTDTPMMEQAEASKKFILACCPELDGKVSDFDLISIFNAYFDNQIGAGAGES